MKKIFYIILISFLFSCNVQRTITETTIKESNYEPATMFPSNFDEAEKWFDYKHNQPVLDKIL